MKKRLNIVMSTSTYKEMQVLAEKLGLATFTALIRRSLALMRVVVDHIGPDGSVTIVTSDGELKILLD